MTNSREMLHSLGNAAAATVYSEQLIPILLEVRWILALPLIVVLADCWFGISESKQKKKPVRFSGAGWKTLRKLLDYYTLLILGYVVAHILPTTWSVAIPEACFYAISIPMIFDLSSIGGHILKLRGINMDLSKVLVKLFVGFVKTKNCEVGTSLEEEINHQIEVNKEEDHVHQ